MSSEKDDEELDTTGVDAAIYRQRIARGRISKLLERIGQSMDAPGGTAWEEEISAPETEEPAEERARSSAQEERERQWREQFRRNWPIKPKWRK